MGSQLAEQIAVPLAPATLSHSEASQRTRDERLNLPKQSLGARP